VRLPHRPTQATYFCSSSRTKNDLIQQAAAAHCRQRRADRVAWYGYGGLKQDVRAKARRMIVY